MANAYMALKIATSAAAAAAAVWYRMYHKQFILEEACSSSAYVCMDSYLVKHVSLMLARAWGTAVSLLTQHRVLCFVRITVIEIIRTVCTSAFNIKLSIYRDGMVRPIRESFFFFFYSRHSIFGPIV